MHRYPGERTPHAHYVGRARRFEPVRMAFVDLFDVVEGVPCTRRPLAIGPVTAGAHVGIDLNVRIGDVLVSDLLGRDLAVDMTGPILLVVGYY
jgi:hypothetical protein